METKDYITISISVVALFISGFSFYLAQSKYNDFRATVSNPNWTVHPIGEGDDRHPTINIEADVSFINAGELPVIVTSMNLIASAYGQNERVPSLEDCSKGAVGGDHGAWDINAQALKPGEVATSHVSFESIRFMTIDYPPDSTNDTIVIVCADYWLVDSKGKSHNSRAPVLKIFGNGGEHPNNIPVLLSD
ncbi:hypothetical protein [Nitrosomonas sp.]|uniref:hypothetical protein n=1 Tax=Nitrosomonas sp. TaxID=42353 RepID=UPI001E0868FE|nr:hypothetical protein [Nitrosomonas sp.]MBX3617658.1 hypothetical protein [Nitrosomonas sp.]